MVTCFTCKLPTSELWAERVPTRPSATIKRPYFSFLTQIPTPVGAILEVDGSVLVCAFCHASLLSQWENGQGARVDHSENKRKSRNVYSLGKFICGVCGVTTYRKRVRALEVQKFPFLVMDQRPVGSLTIGNDNLAVVCLDCYETLRTQNEEYDRWGLPLKSRRFNWLARQPPDPNSPEASVARLPCGKMKLASSPPTEPVTGTYIVAAPKMAERLGTNTAPESVDEHVIPEPLRPMKNEAQNLSGSVPFTSGYFPFSPPSVPAGTVLVPVVFHHPRRKPSPSHARYGCTSTPPPLVSPSRVQPLVRTTSAEMTGSQGLESSSGGMRTACPQVSTPPWIPLRKFSSGDQSSSVKRRRSTGTLGQPSGSQCSRTSSSCSDPMHLEHAWRVKPLCMTGKVKNTAGCVSQSSTPATPLNPLPEPLLSSSSHILYERPASSSPGETSTTCKVRGTVIAKAGPAIPNPLGPSGSMTKYSETSIPVRKRRSGYDWLRLCAESAAGSDRGAPSSSSYKVHERPESSSPVETSIPCKMKETVIAEAGEAFRDPVGSSGSAVTTSSEKCVPIRKRRSGYEWLRLCAEAAGSGVQMRPILKAAGCVGDSECETGNHEVELRARE